MIELVMFHFVPERGLKNLQCGFFNVALYFLLMPHVHSNR